MNPLLTVRGAITTGFVAASDEQEARSRRVALRASRTNFVLSIPLLRCMGPAAHGLPV